MKTRDDQKTLSLTRKDDLGGPSYKADVNTLADTFWGLSMFYTLYPYMLTKCDAAGGCYDCRCSSFTERTVKLAWNLQDLPDQRILTSSLSRHEDDTASCIISPVGGRLAYLGRKRCYQALHADIFSKRFHW